MCQYSHDGIENKLESIVKTLSESDNDKAEVNETVVEESLTNTVKNSCFYTSTPKKRKLQCEAYSKQSKCEDCYFDDYGENYMTKNKLKK